MGFRFRKSFRLAPGLKLNLSKRGVGVSFGGKGFTHSIGPSGRRTTLSAPGTGLSFTTQHKSSRRRPSKSVVAAEPSAPLEPESATSSQHFDPSLTTPEGRWETLYQEVHVVG